ncbi:DUF1795 domain-containing protein [Neisseriaceae bacterium TC5R-5]|nr:DUF1795 domain-containing protein [Neisseriaceae bacterium TC5R-5]
MSKTQRYQIQEGSIELPAGFHDRSTNIFVQGQIEQSGLNLNIARDTLQPAEDLAAYVDRQIKLLNKKMLGYQIKQRQAVQLGNGEGQLNGEQIDATHKSGSQTLHQRQAAFLISPERALIFSATSKQPFTGPLNTLWQNWLASYQAPSQA